MMAAKKSTDVMIAGKVYTLSGYEEEGYLQHVASYINTKISEITERDEYRRIPNDMKSILIQLNIADDYFKAKKQISALEEELAAKDKDLYDLKHELISAQIKLESVEEQVKTLQKAQNEGEKEIVRLETELKKK